MPSIKILAFVFAFVSSVAAAAGAGAVENDLQLPQSGESLLAFAPAGFQNTGAGYQLDRLFDAARGRVFSVDALAHPSKSPKPQSATAQPEAALRPTSEPGARFAQEYKRTFNILISRREKIDRFDPLILKQAQYFRLNPSLLKAIIAAESEFVITAKSPAGARGLMQLMPLTAEYMGVSRHALFDPEANIRAGAAYLSYLFGVLYRRHNIAGNFAAAPGWAIERVIAAYNAGLRFLGKRPLYRETSHYIAKVLLYKSSDVAKIRISRPPLG